MAKRKERVPLKDLPSEKLLALWKLCRQYFEDEKKEMVIHPEVEAELKTRGYLE